MAAEVVGVVVVVLPNVVQCGDIKTKIYLFIFPQSQLLGMMDIVDEKCRKRIKIPFDSSLYIGV